MRHCMPTAYSRYYYSAACLLRLPLCVLLQAESCEHHASTHAVASGGALKTPSSLAVDMALSAVCRGRHLSAARPSAVGLPTVALPGPACHHAAAGRQPFHVVRAAPDAGFTTSSSGAASTSSPMVSPFTQPGVHRQVGEAGTHPREMTVATVDKVLDEVRPVLMADGGDVEVVAVEEGGRVLLRLQGACSSCAASGATLKMGIERALEAAFGDQLTEVVQVDAGSGPPAGTAENIDLHLNLLRSAVASLGGEVRVLSAGSGVAVLGYRGPPAIGRGLVAAVKDAFKDIREVVLKDLPPEEGEQQQQQQPPPSSKAGSS